MESTGVTSVTKKGSFNKLNCIPFPRFPVLLDYIFQTVYGTVLTIVDPYTFQRHEKPLSI